MNKKELLKKIAGKTLKKIRKTLRPATGMTLIELIVVVAILGTLIAILAGSIGDNKKKADEKMAKLKMQSDKVQIIVCLDEYRSEFGSFPGEDLGLKVLYEQVPGSPENWRKICSEKTLMDPFNKIYDYKFDENGQPVISTMGKDGKAGGTAMDADVVLSE